MNAHTSGPWDAQGMDVASQPFVYICRVDSSETAHKDRRTNAPSVAEAYANARLIAAAPELLEALRMADQRISELCKMVCHLSGNPRKVRAEDYAEEVRAALAKAVQS